MFYGTFSEFKEKCRSYRKVTDLITPKLSENVKSVELEDAMDLAGAGRYQIQHLALMSWVLGAALLEIMDGSFVLPAAACDLKVPGSLKGAIVCIPNIGIVLTATFWGSAADHWGRKPVLIISTLGAGFFGALAAFMPNLIGYAVCKLVMSLFLSPPSSLTFAFCGELMTRRRRDLGMLLLSGFINMSTVTTPLLAWGILPHTWTLDLGVITFRPWRLLTLMNALPLLISSLLLSRTLESPKYLVTQGRYDEALNNLKYIYEKNNGSSNFYSVASLKKTGNVTVATTSNKIKEQSDTKGSKKDRSASDLLKPPHIKWLALTSALMFCLYSLLNGLFLFTPDTVNKLMSNKNFNGTICEILLQKEEKDEGGLAPICDDKISTETFKIMAATTFIFSLAVLAVSVSNISKKYILVITYATAGLACLLSGLTKERMLAAISMSGLQLVAMGKGPLTAYTVELFPTSLRGTAVGIVLMFGRLGSILGANIAGLCLAAACEVTFVTWTGIMLVCGILSALALPNTSSGYINIDSEPS